MPSIDIRLAWVTKVKVETLGAHLEAYINLQLTITMLRLCNQFGKGDEAFITRLPVELLKQIEEILLRHERADTCKGWTEDCRCFQALCAPTDHHDTEVLEEMYREAFYDDFIESDHETKARWYDRAGKPTETARGFFSQHKDLLLKHFGLEVWIAHKQHNKARRQWEDGSLFRSTTAYMTLPVSESASKEWDVDYEDNDWSGRSRLPTEVGYAFSLAEPIKPPRKSLRRFPRAMKTLGLRTVSPEDTLDLIADGGDVTDWESGEEKHSEDYKKAPKGWPYLRLLVINRDETMDQL
ncbi:hypothetical protein LTR36_002517 [Oleoguttula mirabilis]|uniref:F-box domain-containing protein n=1 Tax=Oleoguttula mirabilis TaxID=1507867 RepID=A0AAV9JKX0_9PEZI|nr:hypothetical protein LTR36_002517 [Oleoguttula mirabilis]